MASIKRTQEHLLEELTARVVAGIEHVLDDRQIGGGELTEGRVSAIVNSALQGRFDHLSQTLTSRLNAIASTAPALFQSSTEEQNQTGIIPADMQTYELRSHGNGILSRLPSTYDFPSAGVYDCWVKWNIKDTQNKIPPLRLLQAKDFAFTDSKDKSSEDGRGHTGKYKGQRRNSSRTFSDLKFLCEFIEEKASEGGMAVNDRSTTNVRLMYELVQPLLYLPGKDGKICTQNKWRTVVRKLRNQNKLHNSIK